MARRRLTLGDRRDLAEASAWREYGKRNYGWIVGLTFVKILLPWVIVVVPVGILVWWVVSALSSLGGPDVSLSTPESAGPWPWVLLGVSTGTAVFLLAYRWAIPRRGGAGLVLAIVFCVLISALAVMWARTTF